jgi:hypothetical protein
MYIAISDIHDDSVDTFVFIREGSLKCYKSEADTLSPALRPIQQPLPRYQAGKKPLLLFRLLRALGRTSLVRRHKTVAQACVLARTRTSKSARAVLISRTIALGTKIVVVAIRARQSARIIPASRFKPAAKKETSVRKTDIAAMPTWARLNAPRILNALKLQGHRLVQQMGKLARKQRTAAVAIVPRRTTTTTGNARSSRSCLLLNIS